MTSNTSKPVSHYLHPDYLDPLPTNTIDPKQSPLALLAQTCNNIGKDGTVGGCLPQKDQNANNKPSLHHSPSPTTALSIKVSPSATVPAIPATGITTSSPAAKRRCVDEEDKPSSTSIERESPSSTCKTARTTPHKRSAPSSPKRQPHSPRSTSSPTAADSAGIAKSAMAGAAMVPPHSLFQLKSSGFLPDIAHPAALHATVPTSTPAAVAAAAAAAAFGLSGSYGQYSAAAAAAGLPWAGLLPPPPHGAAGSCHDPQCTQCPSHSHHRPGSSSCTCSHCNNVHAKSMADYYHALVQSGLITSPAANSMSSPAATSPGNKANAEFCMYCGKHCPTLEELLTHMRTHDSPSAAAAAAAANGNAGPPPPFGLYPGSGHCADALSPDSLRKAWSYASMASRFHPYRGLMSTRMPQHPGAAFPNFGAPLV